MQNDRISHPKTSNIATQLNYTYIQNLKQYIIHNYAYRFATLINKPSGTENSNRKMKI